MTKNYSGRGLDQTNPTNKFWSVFFRSTYGQTGLVIFELRRKFWTPHVGLKRAKIYCYMLANSFAMHLFFSFSTSLDGSWCLPSDDNITMRKTELKELKELKEPSLWCWSGTAKLSQNKLKLANEERAKLDCYIFGNDIISQLDGKSYWNETVFRPGIQYMSETCRT